MQGQLSNSRTGKARVLPHLRAPRCRGAFYSLVPRRLRMRLGKCVGSDNYCGLVVRLGDRKVILEEGVPFMRTQRFLCLLILPPLYSSFTKVQLGLFTCLQSPFLFTFPSMGLPARLCSPDSAHPTDVAMTDSLHSAMPVGSQLPTLLLPSTSARPLTVT